MIMIKIFSFIMPFIIGSCWGNDMYQIKISNEYSGRLDSLIVNINFKKVAKVINLYSGLDSTIYYSSDNINTSHDVGMYFILYNGGKIVDSAFTFNDLGYLPPLTNITISKNQKLKVNFRK